MEQTVAKDDPDNKARACYGVLFPATNDVWLRFLDGRPVSAVTTSFLAWCCEGAAAQGKTALLLVWDNASWHRSQEVRAWIRVHNRQVKATGAGVRLPICPLPVKSPWLNPIEPKWLHTKRRVIEPNRLLSAQELAERVCDALGCTYHDHIPIPEKACVGRLEYPFESSGILPWRVAAIHSESAAVTGVALSSPVLDKEPPDADSPVPPLCPTRAWA